jgi:hypothetical protein
MSDRASERSAEACPRCGAHRLAAVEPPELVEPGSQPPLSDIFVGRQVGTEPVAPSIECLSCGATWRDLETFRFEQSGGGSHGST